MFEKSREKYKNNENRILIAKVIDKYMFSTTRNKITYTDFLNISEISIISKMLKEEKIYNYVFFGGKLEADRKILIFYPYKFTDEMILKNYDKILSVIRIKLPHNLKYEHRDFLSGIMKLGIKREKFGDIIVTDDGADIITLSEVTDILFKGLLELTRFKKSKISIENINNLTIVEPEFDNIKIIISSNRLDNFVCELVRCSRGNANEIIGQGKVFLNSINEFKTSKKLNVGDIITIRGKGKFIFDEIEKETKNGKFLVNIRKYK